MRTRVIKVTHRETGKSYWFDVKRSWDRCYYSVDGDTWFRTKTEAFRDAEARGILREVA